MTSFEENPIKRGDILKIYTDGASRRNPGPSACAFIFVKGNNEIYSEHKYLGNLTNNQAEYIAIIEALKKAVEYTRWKVEIYSDSELVINQINGEFRIKNEKLKKLHEEICTQKLNFEEVSFLHVSRTNGFISIADRLCNDCLDKEAPGK